MKPPKNTPAQVAKARALERTRRAFRNVVGDLLQVVDPLPPLPPAHLAPDLDPVRGQCRECGCTDTRACEGGCAWADDSHTLCSRCIRRALARAAGILPRVSLEIAWTARIELLHLEAAEEGNAELMATCERALAGDEPALETCMREHIARQGAAIGREGAIVGVVTWRRHDPGSPRLIVAEIDLCPRHAALREDLVDVVRPRHPGTCADCAREAKSTKESPRCP